MADEVREAETSIQLLFLDEKKTIFKIFIALGSLLWALLLGLNNCSPFLRLIFSNTAVNKKTKSLLPRSMIVRLMIL